MGGRQIEPHEIIFFWQYAGKEKWFGEDEQFGKEISDKYFLLWQTALSGRLRSWQASDDGLLALILVFDQFSRNMFRNDPRAYCSDYDALKTARLALENETDQRTNPELRGFLYMPFAHSEKLADQEKSIELFTALNNADLLREAEIRHDIIKHFGRFPQRNKIIGRTTKPDEQIFLNNHNIKS